MKDRTYNISFQLNVSANWVEDGVSINTLKRRITEELPGNLCPYAMSHEITINKIKVKIHKS